MMLFENHKEVTLSKMKLMFFDNELDNVARAALPKKISPETERKRQLESEEIKERKIDERQKGTDASDTKEDVYSENLRCSIRTVEVMDIITKNRVGPLEKQKLEEIIAEAINVNLRILSSFFDIIKDKNEQREIIKYISNQLQILKTEKNLIFLMND